MSLPTALGVPPVHCPGNWHDSTYPSPQGSCSEQVPTLLEPRNRPVCGGLHCLPLTDSYPWLSGQKAHPQNRKSPVLPEAAGWAISGLRKKGRPQLSGQVLRCRGEVGCGACLPSGGASSQVPQAGGVACSLRAEDRNPPALRGPPWTASPPAQALSCSSGHPPPPTRQAQNLGSHPPAQSTTAAAPPSPL